MSKNIVGFILLFGLHGLAFGNPMPQEADPMPQEAKEDEKPMPVSIIFRRLITFITLFEALHFCSLRT